MHASLVALAASLVGIVLERTGTPPYTIIGTALIMGAFIIAITSFLLFLKDWILTNNTDEIMWESR
jgi:hypothetical protein